MEEKPATRATSLDRVASFALIIIVELQAILLYAAYKAGENQVGLFLDRTFLTVWYSLVVIPPSVVSLLLRSAVDRFAWVSGLAVAVLVGLLAWHTGNACGPNEAVQCRPVIWPYVCSLAVAHFILVPFIQGFRDHGRRIPYSALFRDSWDNALTIGAAGIFVGAAWLILILWAALFSLVGIEFFKELFALQGFIFPVTGLLAGFGVVLARHQAGALQAVLRVCLSLGRALLPLISILALVFLGTLIFTGLKPLWDTKNATTLLLLLIFGTVSLVNSVLHDGTGVESYRPALRRLLGAALLTLPVYAVLAAIALALRVKQYAWTVDRLWAGVVVIIAAAYAFAYASSVIIRRRDHWLSLLPSANIAVALMIVALLLATQSPLLDFRSITVSSQLARLNKQSITLDRFDFEYFRWELGRPGYAALVVLRDDPRVTGSPEIARHVKSIIEDTQRWYAQGAWSLAELKASDLRIIPMGETLPAGLLEFINGRARLDYTDGRNCFQGGCVLAGVDVFGSREREWILIDTELKPWVSFPIYTNQTQGWDLVGYIGGQNLMDNATVNALEKGQISAEQANLRDVVIGNKRLRIDSRH